MKKICFLLLGILSLQMVNAQGLGFGFKVGANMNKIDGQAFKDGYNLGYHVGAFAELGLGKKLSLQPELVLNQINTEKASTVNQALNNWQNNTSDIKLNYLTVPILLKYKLTNALALNLGPQFGILLNQDNSVWNNAGNAVKGGDLALAAGLTVNFSSLRVYGRYNIGLNNISDVQSTDSWKTQQIQFGLGYKIL